MGERWPIGALLFEVLYRVLCGLANGIYIPYLSDRGSLSLPDRHSDVEVVAMKWTFNHWQTYPHDVLTRCLCCQMPTQPVGDVQHLTMYAAAYGRTVMDSNHYMEVRECQKCHAQFERHWVYTPSGLVWVSFIGET